MTLAFLELPAAERKVYIDEAAARRGLAPVSTYSHRVALRSAATIRRERYRE